MQSRIRHRTFKAAQALSAEGRWGGSYLKPLESAKTRALKDRANRLYAIGELRQAAELLTQSGPGFALLEVRPCAVAACGKMLYSSCDQVDCDRCGQPFCGDPE
jgi:hypothetical protein